MGGGNYSHEAHEAHTRSRVDLPREEVFRSRNLRDDMDLRKKPRREARDSPNHPLSVAIIFALDETGSMGHIPEGLAKQTLPGFMKVLMDGGFVTDPQLCFVGVGDGKDLREQAPIQMGEFESEAEHMDRWLTGIYLEGRGHGNGGESYDLALFAAARHTDTDCWEKRRHKGYLFMTGDDNAFPFVDQVIVERYIGARIDKDIPIQDIVVEAAERYNIFFLVPDQDRRVNCEASWRELIGDHVICLEAPEDTAYAAAALVGLTEGKTRDLDELQRQLGDAGVEKQQIARVVRAVEPYARALERGGEKRKAEEGDIPRGTGTSGNRRRGSSADAV